MPNVLYSVGEFAKKQGCKPVWVLDRWIFPNGAQSDGKNNHMDPPEDPIAVLQLRRLYTRAKLEATIEHYNNDRNAINTQAYYHQLGVGPPPEPGWESHLEKYVAEIEELQAELQKLTDQLPELKQMEEYLARRAKQRREAAEIMGALAQFPNYRGRPSSDSLV